MWIFRPENYGKGDKQSGCIWISPSVCAPAQGWCLGENRANVILLEIFFDSRWLAIWFSLVLAGLHAMPTLFRMAMIFCWNIHRVEIDAVLFIE